MASCCNDPTEPPKIDPRALFREQEHYGNLLRDLFTDDPERVIRRQLYGANAYLRELAALRAHYPSIRCQAIGLLEKNSMAVLEKISQEEVNTQFGDAAKKRIEQLCDDKGLLDKLFHT